MKLGCLPSNTIKLSGMPIFRPRVPGTLPPVPATVDHTNIGDHDPWGALGNDKWNDCTVAAAGHAVQLAAWWAQAPRATIDLQKLTGAVVDAYKGMTNNSPKDPGVGTETVLPYWNTNGLDGQTCDAVRAFNWDSVDSWKQAIYLFGFAFIVVMLPDAVADSSRHDGAMQWTKTSQSPQTIPPENCHCVIVAAYSDKGLKVISGGNVRTMSWEFAAWYTIEAYAVLLNSWATGKPPNGLSYADLNRYLPMLE